MLHSTPLRESSQSRTPWQAARDPLQIKGMLGLVCSALVLFDWANCQHQNKQTKGNKIIISGFSDNGRPLALFAHAGADSHQPDYPHQPATPGGGGLRSSVSLAHHCVVVAYYPFFTLPACIHVSVRVSDTASLSIRSMSNGWRGKMEGWSGGKERWKGEERDSGEGEEGSPSAVLTVEEHRTI